jgi:hypothetical protein
VRHVHAVGLLPQGTFAGGSPWVNARREVGRERGAEASNPKQRRFRLFGFCDVGKRASCHAAELGADEVRGKTGAEEAAI